MGHLDPPSLAREETEAQGGYDLQPVTAVRASQANETPELVRR